MQNPCERCKKKNKCPGTCFPKKDYLRALKKRNKKRMKKQFRITCTHNPQDFYNGEEPAELSKSYITSDLEKDVSNELDNGYKVIVSKLE